MLGRATGASLIGVDACLVEVEVDLGGGLPSIAAVGLPDTSVREGIDRIRAALRNAGFQLPQRRVIVNLAPAELRKQGSGLDLPIAAGILTADGQIGPLRPEGTVLCGELALDGSVRPVRGAVSIAVAARDAGRQRLLAPAACAAEAALVEGLEVIPVATLADVAALSGGPDGPRPVRVDGRKLLRAANRAWDGPDLREVRGQPLARRALEVAAAGGHNLLMSGPPGAGKTMLARRVPAILPPLTLEEALEATRVWSASGLSSGLVAQRPFRSPHHGVSAAGLTGGGTYPRPGEISLATHGVLFLDELPEFRRDALEALRQPLEEGRVTITRARARVSFPARFALVAAMNPCPCGHHASTRRSCRCTPNEIRRYRAKLSGPLLDRFDILVEVPPLDLEHLASRPHGEGSASVRRRVVAARHRQHRRFRRAGPTCNARMTDRDLERHAVLGEAARTALLEDCKRLGYSARGLGRIRRVARTIADLAGIAEIGREHVAEAALLRRALDRFLEP